MATKIVHLGSDRLKYGLITETFERFDTCRAHNCKHTAKQELFVTQRAGNAICIQCCIRLHGPIVMNKNGN